MRLQTVFACPLIHGLGLASSLEQMGWDKAHLLVSLLGFNVGVELGQLLVMLLALGTGALVLTVGRLNAARTLPKARALAGFVAIGIGSFWFVQRVMGW